jgi:hypothetical protein
VEETIGEIGSIRSFFVVVFSFPGCDVEEEEEVEGTGIFEAFDEGEVLDEGVEGETTNTRSRVIVNEIVVQVHLFHLVSKYLRSRN